MDNNSLFNNIYNTQLPDKEFNQLSQYIQNNYGIKMPPAKKIVLQGRLQKRLRKLQIPDYKSYVEYVFSKEGENEIIHMMDVVSTNKTDFYREPIHFEILAEEILPKLLAIKGRGKINVWSAGCSSGEEPYTIAIVLNEFKDKNPGFDFTITATDISTQMLQNGANAIYKEERIEIIPLNLKKKYFLKSKDRTTPMVRVNKELRNKVNFMRLNFMNTTYQVNEMFDIIFCRNALIYFERDNQEQVINKLCNKLHPSGYFFLGHSESITNMKVPLKSIRPTVFTKL
ncbi:MAG: methyltransferase domain-containing protein [Salinivirgaceae bacterium]|jgi:chemotaxis protein methyltransferase CheR|nr:methyltransferase domain-containing protein [Salinivirgaceae bacterium]